MLLPRFFTGLLNAVREGLGEQWGAKAALGDTAQWPLTVAQCESCGWVSGLACAMDRCNCICACEYPPLLWLTRPPVEPRLEHRAC